MRAWLGLLALAGCDHVFGLGDPYEDAHSTNGSDAAVPVDARPGDSLLPPPNLLGHWAFENNLTNDVDGGQGTCSGCTYLTGKHGLAVHLDGTNCIQTVLVPDHAPAQFTILLWAKAGGSAKATLLSRQTTATSGEFPWLLDGDLINVNATMWDGGTNAVVQDPGLVSGSWVHVAETYDGSTLRLYVGMGSIVSTGQTTAGPPYYGTRSDIFFGCTENGVGNGYTGELDDIYLFDRALTVSEIATYL